MNPISVSEVLALSYVPRWSVVRHGRPQSVADHTFRTLAIALELEVRLKQPLPREAIVQILFHDALEARSGDIPNPWKRKYDCGPRLPELPAIARLADLIEAYTFLCAEGQGNFATCVATSMSESLIKLVDEEFGHSAWDTVAALIWEITADIGREGIHSLPDQTSPFPDQATLPY